MFIHSLDFLQAALRGDENETKMYCGSYALVIRDGQLYRCREDPPPNGYTAVTLCGGQPVHDNDGFLQPQFWSLPRIDDRY